MQNIKSVPVLVLLFLGVLLFAGCYKTETVYLETGEEITRAVSFTQDLVPIFNNSCNTSGCHNAGGKAPDLSAVNAYSSLTNGGYINTSDPEGSELYQWMTGKRGTPMPPGGINPDYNSYVIAWIKQGALNN